MNSVLCLILNQLNSVLFQKLENIDSKLSRLEYIDSKLLRLENVETLLKQVVLDQGRIMIGLENAEIKLGSRSQQSGNADDGEQKNADGQITQIANTDGQIILTDIKLKPDGGQAITTGGQTPEVVEDAAFKKKKAADRKERMRLKERLRNSMRRESLAEESLSTTWADYIFGISTADQRSGKEGSRSSRLNWMPEFSPTRSLSGGSCFPPLQICVCRIIHPSSRFSQGDAARRHSPARIRTHRPLQRRCEAVRAGSYTIISPARSRIAPFAP
jgi:hypothetical protein